ncbi:MAG: hypothetical protein NTZ32_17180 [Planctomycetales bacterium]|nr:hypothetical protein [Planctomycetales bacterium]
MFPDDLLAWVQATQPQAWDAIVKNHGSNAAETLLSRVRDQLNQRGTLDVHIEADDSADRNAAIAGKVILDLAKLEQADRHHRDKMDLADRKLTAISAA